MRPVGKRLQCERDLGSRYRVVSGDCGVRTICPRAGLRLSNSQGASELSDDDGAARRLSPFVPSQLGSSAGVPACSADVPDLAAALGPTPLATAAAAIRFHAGRAPQSQHLLARGLWGDRGGPVRQLAGTSCRRSHAPDRISVASPAPPKAEAIPDGPGERPYSRLDYPLHATRTEESRGNRGDGSSAGANRIWSRLSFYSRVG